MRPVDPYAIRGKHPDPSACPECHAIYRAGRWTWGTPPADAERVVCPACRRIADAYPAGVIELRGAYLRGHREELERLARNVELRESAEHPLKRIMAIRKQKDGALEITTTDGKLARSIGNSLRRAHDGKLLLPRPSRENIVRVRWER
jgi:hypothetical protein